MSAYSEQTTEFKDGEVLIQALLEMGFGEVRNCIGNPEQLEDYQGRKRKQVADIIIPRKYVPGASNDIGFVRNADGKFGEAGSDVSKRFSRRNRTIMAKVVKVTLDPETAEFSVDNTGFQGKGCDDIVRIFGELGSITKEIHKPEYKLKTVNVVSK